MTIPIHIDINTSDVITLDTYDNLLIDDNTCKTILSTTLDSILNNHPELADKPISLSLYLVDSGEGKTLNHDYRGKDYATNVLSFPSDLPAEIIPELDEYPLGELIICLPVVIREAKEQGKTPQHHFTHLLVHGCLHLLGYDHELSDTVTEQDAADMEAIEVAVLSKLEIANPYD